MNPLTRAVNATLMPGFVGPLLPDWLAAELADGLGSVCLFATNIVDPEQTRALCDAIHAANPAALIATAEPVLALPANRLYHVAPGSTAPDWSSTVPSMTPVVACDWA